MLAKRKAPSWNLAPDSSYAIATTYSGSVLHPDLLPALGRLIIAASKHTQVWVVSHASRLIATLEEHPECNCLHLDKELGQTRIRDQGMFDAPAWHWAD